MSSNFYKEVFKECEVFFGKETENFLDRQIEWHLSKTSDTVDYSDKNDFAWWIKISAGLVLNKEDAEKLYNKVMAIKKPI